MSRKKPTTDTLKLLYVHSGNECAFPSCNHPIFNDNGLLIAQLCHINSANEGGQRFDENQTDDERRSIANLMFLCHRHHKETDDSSVYTVEKLTEIKNNHEAKYTEGGKQATKEMIDQIESEINYFWVRQSNKIFDFQDLKIVKDFEKDLFDIINDLIDNIESVATYCDICAESDDSITIENDLQGLFIKAGLDYTKINEVPSYENPFTNRNFDLHQIGRPNYFSHISLCISQLKVKIIDEMIKHDPQNDNLKELAIKFRKEFEEDYDCSYYVD